MRQIRCLLLLFLLFKETLLNGYTVINPIRFPLGNPFMGIFVAVATPIETGVHDLSFSFDFQAFYMLPKMDERELTYPPIISKRSLEREQVYQILERRLDRLGYAGKPCLLRAICEAAEHTFEGNGLLADLLHLMLTPSTSKDEQTKEYRKAENYGKTKGNCAKYQKSCGTSLLSLISVVQKPFFE